MTEQQPEQAAIPAVKRTVHQGEFTPYNWSGRNLFRNWQWLTVFIGMFFVLYTPELMHIAGDMLSNIQDHQLVSDLIIIMVITYWAACFLIPAACIHLIEKKMT